MLVVVAVAAGEAELLALVGRWLAELSFAGTFDWVAVVDRTASLERSFHIRRGTSRTADVAAAHRRRPVAVAAVVAVDAPAASSTLHDVTVARPSARLPDRRRRPFLDPLASNTYRTPAVPRKNEAEEPPMRAS